MTTIAFKDGVIAADSCATYSGGASGDVYHPCEKLYRKQVGNREVIIATAGESSPSLVFVDWYGSGAAPPESLLETDFHVLIVEADGIYEADGMCRPDKILAKYYAIGSGKKCALAAMACGKSARDAVKIAAMFDPYTRGPITTMRLKRGKS